MSSGGFFGSRRILGVYGYNLQASPRAPFQYRAGADAAAVCSALLPGPELLRGLFSDKSMPDGVGRIPNQQPGYFLYTW